MQAVRPRPDPLALEVLLRRLPARRRLARRIQVLARCPSTQDEARGLAEDPQIGAAELDGLLLVAEEQTAGRGRKARDWWAGPPGANLALSLILSPPTSPPESLGLLAACALAATCAPYSAQPAAIKWPNDVLLGGAKLAGFLTEIPSLPHGRPEVAILGLGLNVHVAPPPGAAPYPTTSLAAASTRPPERTALLGLWLLALERRLAAFERQGSAQVEAELLARLRLWAPFGVRAGPDDPGGPLIEFSVSQGLSWGSRAAPTVRLPGLIPDLEPLPEPSSQNP